jgi:hypothetical protein
MSEFRVKPTYFNLTPYLQIERRRRGWVSFWEYVASVRTQEEVDKVIAHLSQPVRQIGTTQGKEVSK